jgi:hypothetical protein
MTIRENLEAAWRGEAVEQIPFALYGSFFNGPAGPALREIEGLGIIGTASPWKSEYPSVQVETQTLPDGSELTIYRTPLGELSQRRVVEPGYGSMWTMDHLVKRPEDWRVVQYLVEDKHYSPAPEAFDDADVEMGEQGIVMAPVERMPFQRLWIEFGDIEQLCYLLADDRDKLDRMISAMTVKDAECWQLVARSDAEFVWAPDNVTADILGPELFQRYAQPYYEALAEVMHPHHKRIVAHFDGHLAALAELIAATPVDVVESFTPPPNGNIALGEAWEAWAPRVLVVNYPPAGHLAEPEQIKARMVELVGQVPAWRRLAFEISENVPEDLIAINCEAIQEALEELAEGAS